MGVSVFFTVSDSAVSHAQSLLTLSGPIAKAHAGTIWGLGAFSRGQSTQRLFIFRKCQLTGRRCSKMPIAPGSCCLQTGAWVLRTWINTRVGFSSAAKCLSTVQPSASQTLTKIFLLMLQQVLNWRLRSDSCLEPVILKTAPGSYVQILTWFSSLGHLWKCAAKAENMDEIRGYCKVALQLPNNGSTLFLPG